jgi:hypothetical protein
MTLQKQQQIVKKIKEATILFCIQIVSYGLLCVNFRAVAQAQYHLAAVTDFTLASMSFFIIRKISKSEDAVHQWAGYVAGSVVGSYLGIYISTLIK